MRSTGALWAEGPAWSSQGQYVVFSDLSGNVQYRYIWDDSRVTAFRRLSYTDLPEISGHECRFDLGHVIGASYRMGEAGAQGTAQSERIRRWLVANRFQAISQASMMSARLINTVLASQWLRR